MDEVREITNVGVVVEDERVCVACGYALVGLPIEGVCPECGVEVRRSLGERLLHDADAGYLRALARGAGLVMWGVWLGLGLFFGSIVAIVAGGVLQGMGQPIPRDLVMVLERAANVLIPLLGLAGVIVSVIGWWKITSADPGAPASDRGAVIRRRARWLFVGAGVLLMLIVLLEMSGLSSASLFGQLVPWMVLGLSGLLALVMLLWFQVSMRVVRGLADRVPDRTLRARARRCAVWAWVAAGWQLALVGWLFVIAWLAMVNSGNTLVALGLWTGGVFVGMALGLVLFIMYAMMAARLRGACGRAWERATERVTERSLPA